jgi:hypothetical protein
MMNRLIRIVVKSTLILTAATLASIGLHRESASLRHAVLTLALLGTLALPAMTLITPVLDVPILPGTTGTPDLTTPDRDAGEWNTVSPTVGPTYSVPPSTELNILPEPLTRPAPAPWTGMTLGQWLMFTWALGASLVLLRLLVGAWTVRRMGRRSKELDGVEWNALIESLRAKLGIRRYVSLRIS